MAEQYTPTTEDVRDHFAYGCGPQHTWDESRKAFDSWRAAHDAQVRAEALREARDTVMGMERAFVTSEWGTVVRKLDARDAIDRIADTNQENGSGS